MFALSVAPIICAYVCLKLISLPIVFAMKGFPCKCIAHDQRFINSNCTSVRQSTTNGWPQLPTSRPETTRSIVDTRAFIRSQNHPTRLDRRVSPSQYSRHTHIYLLGRRSDMPTIQFEAVIIFMHRIPITGSIRRHAIRYPGMSRNLGPSVSRSRWTLGDLWLITASLIYVSADVFVETTTRSGH